MKALVRILLFVLLIGGALYLFAKLSNTTLSPETIDLTVDCPPVDDMLVTATVDVTVSNRSTRSHKDVSVKIIAYDEGGKVIREKYTTFDRTLAPHASFSKPVTLPARTQRCSCEVVSSNPE
ncbi:hypothetical protein GCM10023189_09940 [Nibrella saemangeumensis]|uniref:CARDB domain-containing protein n=1 Tax=Nibrella saemangeumensis TaxID=1084526 RepID=A0ABP8MGM7_9BACT